MAKRSSVEDPMSVSRIIRGIPVYYLPPDELEEGLSSLLQAVNTRLTQMVANQKRFWRVCWEINDNIAFNFFDYICLYRYRLEEVVGTEADAVEQIETEAVAAYNILHPGVLKVETITEMRSQRYLVRYAVGDSRDYGYAELVEVAL